MDIKTLIFLLAFGNLIFGVMLVLFEWRAKPTRRNHFWIIAKVMQAFGWFLLYDRGAIPDWASISIGNFLLLSGFGYETWAMLFVSGRPVSRQLEGTTLAGTFLLCVLLNTQPPAARVALASFYSAIFFSLSGWIMLRTWRSASALRTYIGWSMMGLFLIVSARGTWALLKPEGFELFSENSVQIVTFLSMFYLLLTNGFGMLLLTKEAGDQELQISEARLAQAQEVAHVGSWELVLATRSIWASPEAYRIYGLPDSASSFSLAVIQSFADAEDRPRLDAAMQDLLQGNAPYDLEYSLQRANDKVRRVIHSKATLVRNESGAPQKVVGVIQDITERKEAENQLKSSLAEKGRLLQEVQEAMEKVKQLKGLLPICAWCKKVRDDQGYWNQIEVYVREHSDVDFSHGCCPECAERELRKIKNDPN